MAGCSQLRREAAKDHCCTPTFGSVTNVARLPSADQMAGVPHSYITDRSRLSRNAYSLLVVVDFRQALAGPHVCFLFKPHKVRCTSHTLYCALVRHLMLPMIACFAFMLCPFSIMQKATRQLARNRNHRAAVPDEVSNLFRTCSKMAPVPCPTNAERRLEGTQQVRRNLQDTLPLAARHASVLAC